jgi:hypothetical protein
VKWLRLSSYAKPASQAPRGAPGSPSPLICSASPCCDWRVKVWLMTPLHFSAGSSRRRALAMQRHFGNGVLAAVSPAVGKPVKPAAVRAARSSALGWYSAWSNESSLMSPF